MNREEEKLYKKRIDCLFNLVRDNQLKVEELQKKVRKLENYTEN